MLIIGTMCSSNGTNKREPVAVVLFVVYVLRTGFISSDLYVKNVIDVNTFIYLWRGVF